MKPRIIAEQFLSNGDRDLSDYKVHCFNGEPKVVLVCEGRFSDKGMTEDFFDADWTHLDVRRPAHPNDPELIQKPAQLDEMLEISRKLSADIPFLRVDFYIVQGQLYVGELTFFPASGFQKFEPEEWDFIFGSYLELPDKHAGD